MSAFSAAQQRRATALYRSLLRTTRSLFAKDQRAVDAARAETRRRFAEAKSVQDPSKIDEGLEMGEQVVTLLRHNVVQGVYSEENQAYRTCAHAQRAMDADATGLRFSKDTELGSNDTIRQRKPAPSRDEILRSRGSRTPACSAAYSTLAPRMTARGYATGRRATEAEENEAPMPRPVPRFPGITILADGSSIQLTTTSPRHLNRLTRDPTNHPLWNPGMGGRSDADAEDDTGRLGRFRRRFGEDTATIEQEEGLPAPEAARGSVMFDESDLDWMSGGREARAGSPLQTKKGKGRK